MRATSRYLPLFWLSVFCLAACVPHKVKPKSRADAGADAADGESVQDAAGGNAAGRADAEAMSAQDAGADAMPEGSTMPGIANAGGQCSKGARACSAHGSVLPLVCSNGQWQSASRCADDKRCDTSAAHQGTCQPVVAECAGETAGKAFCVADFTRLCVDLVSFQDTACNTNATCVVENGDARCGCKDGYQDAQGACVDIDECATDNGGCDSLTTCTNTAGDRTCGDCPTGYTGSGSNGCTPLLAALTVSPGTLTFSPLITEYTIDIPVTAQTVALTPTAVAEATVEINGQAATSGMAWQSTVLTLGANTFDIVVSHPAGTQQRHYSVQVNRGHEETYLKATKTGPGQQFTSGDQFGSGVGISGDTLVVGALSGGPGGAIYVFVRDGATWSQQAQLTFANGQGPDISVAIAGNTIVAGAPSYNPDGAAYVFERTDTTWSAAQPLPTSTTGPVFGIGTSVAIEGDTVVLGAPGANSGRGGAFVFVRSGATWSQQTLLVADNNTSGRLGVSVGISGESIVAGADQSNMSGAAYVFTRSGTSWSQQAMLTARSPDASDSFGASVGIAGNTVVVGAYGEDSGATGIDGDESDNTASGAGAAYVFVRNGTAWSQQAYLKPSTATGGFGWQVAISANTVLVSTPFETGGASGLNGDPSAPSLASSGAVYLFGHENGHWFQRDYLKATNPGASDQFGRAVAISNDTVVVGAHFEAGSSQGVDGPDDDASPQSGAAYVLW